MADLDAVVAGAGFAGTWFWNSYPGARCDVESKDYSFSFSPELEQDWSWSERYPAQPEILRYLSHVADRFDLRPHIQLSTRVTRAEGLHVFQRTPNFAVPNRNRRARTVMVSSADVDGDGQLSDRWR